MGQFQDTGRDHNLLHVIIVISNPAHFAGRYRLFRDMVERLKRTEGIHVVAVEHAFGHRRFEVTDADNMDHVQVRGSSELWLKENMINLGVQRLHLTHPDWQYVAWIDSDIAFENPNWPADTIHALQHHPVVQMFETSKDLGKDGHVIRTRTSFGAQYQRSQPIDRSKYQGFSHTGYAWAITREAFDALGGLIDYDIIGSADWHMAYGMVGRIHEVIPPQLQGPYRRWLVQFQERCDWVIKRNLGYVPGCVVHHWHGSISKRKYETRWKILDDAKFNPETDIIKDSQGLYTFAGNKPQFQADMRAYFIGRDEDNPND